MRTRQMVKRVGQAIIKLSDFGGIKTGLNLRGDRDIEWSWAAAHIPDNPGMVLDFGCGDAFLSLIAAMKGGNVTGLDRQAIRLAYQIPNLKIKQADILDNSIEEEEFDVIINCSSIEHVGLEGRYGSTDVPDGDLVAMEYLRRRLKEPNGIMILTMPVGQDAVFAPFHRVYGSYRLSLLLKDFSVVKQEFWSKKPGVGYWSQVPKEEALAVKPTESFYALGLFILKPDRKDSLS